MGMTIHYKFRDYIRSVIDMTVEAENKNPICYYFPINRDDLIKYMDVIKQGYENDILPVKLLWNIYYAIQNEKQ